MEIAIAIEDDDLARRVLLLVEQADLGDIGCAVWNGGASTPPPEVAIVAALGSAGVESSSLRELLEQVGAAALVVIAPAGAPAPIRRLLSVGVRALVELERLNDTLALALQAVRNGQILLPESVGWALTRPALSVREKQILAMVVLGLSNREIADKLFVAESTVKTHLVSVFRKLEVRSRREAVGLILDPQQGLGTGILAISDR